MAVPVIIVRLVAGQVIRAGSRWAQRELVKKGTLAVVRGDIARVGLSKGQTTVLGSALRANKGEFIKNLVFNQLTDELADAATAGYVHYEIARADQLRARNQAALAAREEARLEAAFAFASAFIAEAVALSPEASREYRNKWVEAGRLLAITQERERELIRTREAETLAQTLRRQADRYEELARAREGPLRGVRARQDLIVAAELRRRAAVLDDPRAEIVGSDEVGAMVEVPPLPPPARARVEVHDDSTTVTLENTVPYAPEVEARYLVAARAAEHARRAAGIARDAYIARIRRARATVGVRDSNS